MATKFVHRLIMVVPAAIAPAANTWLRDNVNPDGSDWLVRPIRVIGGSTTTHVACDVALNDDQLEAIARRLVQIVDANDDLPPGFKDATLTQKRTWCRDTMPRKLWQDAPAARRIGVHYVENDGDWSDHDFAGLLGRIGLELVPGEELS